MLQSVESIQVLSNGFASRDIHSDWIFMLSYKVRNTGIVTILRVFGIGKRFMHCGD